MAARQRTEELLRESKVPFAQFSLRCIAYRHVWGEEASSSSDNA